MTMRTAVNRACTTLMRSMNKLCGTHAGTMLLASILVYSGGVPFIHESTMYRIQFPKKNRYTYYRKAHHDGKIQLYLNHVEFSACGRRWRIHIVDSMHRPLSPSSMRPLATILGHSCRHPAIMIVDKSFLIQIECDLVLRYVRDTRASISSAFR